MFGQSHRLTRIAAGLTLLVASVLPACAEITLLMGEERGCIYCARWDREIAPAYPKTAEGRAAPLQRIDIHSGDFSGITLAGPIVYTPTFVLLDDGMEIGRLEGYAGEDFFWFQLGTMLTNAGVDYDPNG